MARRNVLFLILVAFISSVMVGCIPPEPSKRLNAPPQGDSAMRSDLAEFFAYHNDQGMMADMSIADIHFVPHSSHLSGIGEARLERYAELLADSGGTLNYDTVLYDPQLIKDRLAAAKDFLTQVSPGNHSIAVVIGLSGGRGMSSDEAIAGRDVAKQPEPRKKAYHLADTSDVRATGN